MAHTGSTFAPNAALGNGVPSLATVKASIDARRPQGCRAGATAAPAPAPPPSPSSAWLRPEAQRSRGRGCTAQQVAGCADGWCCEHRCHAGGVCVARERCVCATAHASQHAWNLHQHCTLVQVPLILNRLLKECCQKNVF